MKFCLQNATKCGRLGIITEISRLPEMALETPLLLLYTKGGSVPHLTHEVLEMVSHEQHPLCVSLPTTIHMHSPVAEIKKGLASFIGMKDYMIYCGVQDPAVVSPSGYNEKGAVSVWSRSGNHSLTPDMYMDLIEAFQPDMYQALCDGDTDIHSSKKRTRKCVDRTSEFLKHCVRRHKASKTLQSSSLLAVIEGGYSVHARQESARAASQHPVSGFVIDGLHTNGPDVEKITFSSIREVIQETVKLLPEDKPRITHGCWNPDMVLKLVESGIDVFDSSYPFIVSERGSALVFCNSLDYEHTKQHSPDSPIKEEETNKSINIDSRKQAVKSDKGENCKNLNSDSGATVHSSTTGANGVHDSNDTVYEISLKDDRFCEDFEPVVASCQCLCCKKHTRAYIHHLLMTNELLAPVLLSVHNMHHYLAFFRSIRTAVTKGDLELLRNNIKLKM
ncbi:queuine tRNA-ribosyltransferase accessory subunit 2 [Schistocerca nitens]|uniref:queuine tRNA-ribosyltransferase accessory subunit 2 n=1 Tax=Schistocerca nitens TaxID=7011 RepID=UPI002117648E|nr:queuine tRNA-ribosyltransferase accessory subunit 2 [Schistocerca nitens]